MVSRITRENDLAVNLLTHASQNPNIHNILQSIAKNAIAKILKPFWQEVVQQQTLPFEQYPPLLKKALDYLADKHVYAEHQFGGLLPQFKSKEDILNASENISLLFKEIEKCLLMPAIENVPVRSSQEGIHNLLSILKCLADLGWCYFECLPQLHTARYDDIKNMIWPTPEEFFDARLRRNELGPIKMLAKTFGIGTEVGKDLVPAYNGLGWEAGKSIFAGVSMQKRLEWLTKQFDLNVAYQEGLDPKDETAVKIANITVDTLRKKMQYYNIPLDAASRLPLSEYASQYKTTFEKLAELPLQSGNEALPLIASVSGSSARALIALQDVACFLTDDNKYNLDAMQILANNFAAYYIHCGHHSFLEVAEVYNRLLDYIAIYDKERLPVFLQDKQATGKPYLADYLENRLPYYHIGDDKSFLHASFANEVVTAAKRNFSFIQ